MNCRTRRIFRALPTRYGMDDYFYRAAVYVDKILKEQSRAICQSNSRRRSISAST
jgi:hypothetical protein